MNQRIQTSSPQVNLSAYYKFRRQDKDINREDSESKQSIQLEPALSFSSFSISNNFVEGAFKKDEESESDKLIKKEKSRSIGEPPSLLDIDNNRRISEGNTNQFQNKSQPIMEEDHTADLVMIYNQIQRQKTKRVFKQLRSKSLKEFNRGEGVINKIVNKQNNKDDQTKQKQRRSSCGYKQTLKKYQKLSQESFWSAEEEEKRVIAMKHFTSSGIARIQMMNRYYSRWTPVFQENISENINASQVKAMNYIYRLFQNRSFHKKKQAEMMFKGDCYKVIFKECCLSGKCQNEHINKIKGMNQWLVLSNAFQDQSFFSEMVINAHDFVDNSDNLFEQFVNFYFFHEGVSFNRQYKCLEFCIKWMSIRPFTFQSNKSLKEKMSAFIQFLQLKHLLRQPKQKYEKQLQPQNKQIDSLCKCKQFLIGLSEYEYQQSLNQPSPPKQQIPLDPNQDSTQIKTSNITSPKKRGPPPAKSGATPVSGQKKLLSKIDLKNSGSQKFVFETSPSQQSISQEYNSKSFQAAQSSQTISPFQNIDSSYKKQSIDNSSIQQIHLIQNKSVSFGKVDKNDISQGSSQNLHDYTTWNNQKGESMTNRMSTFNKNGSIATTAPNTVDFRSFGCTRSETIEQANILSRKSQFGGISSSRGFSILDTQHPSDNKERTPTNQEWIPIKEEWQDNQEDDISLLSNEKEEQQYERISINQRSELASSGLRTAEEKRQARIEDHKIQEQFVQQQIRLKQKLLETSGQENVSQSQQPLDKSQLDALLSDQRASIENQKMKDKEEKNRMLNCKIIQLQKCFEDCMKNKQVFCSCLDNSCIQKYIIEKWDDILVNRIEQRLNRQIAKSTFQRDILNLIDVDVIVEQLCLIDHEIISKIEIEEFFSNKKLKQFQIFNEFSERKGISQMRQRLNIFTNYFVLLFLIQNNEKEQLLYLEKLIEMSSAALFYQNYALALNIYFTFNSSTILTTINTLTHKLQNSSKQKLKQLELSIQFQKSFFNLKQLMINAQPPLVPALNIITRDMTLLELQFPDNVTQDYTTFLCIDKFEQISTTAAVFFKAKRHNYPFILKPPLYSFFKVSFMEFMSQYINMKNQKTIDEQLQQLASSKKA